MDTAAEIREFLMTRRAGLTPQDLGLPNFGGRRRVAGLRREEVALVAGISAEYYTRLERGNATGVSESVLDGVARALQLDDVETAHLYDLVRASNSGLFLKARPAAKSVYKICPRVQQILDGMSDMPAIVQSANLDIVASNRLGRAFYTDMHQRATRLPNFGRFIFLDPDRSQVFYRNWEEVSLETVSLLRHAAGRNPNDPVLTNLVGELSMGSSHFRTLWATHSVREYRSGDKKVHHPIVGDLDLSFEAMELASHDGLRLIIYTTEPDSRSADGLQLLANWAAAPAPEHAAANDTPTDTVVPTQNGSDLP